MPAEWLSVKLDDEAAIAAVSSQLEADELPHVAVLKANGTVVTTDGRSII